MNNSVWVWVGHVWSDRVRMVLEHYGDRLTDVSIFGWSVSRDGTLTRTFDPSQLDPYREMWPHIRFWGLFRNMDDPSDGPRAIFDALRDSPTARAHLASEVQTKIFDAYPWLHGVDIDMESGGNSRSADSEAIFKVVADQAHSTGRQVSAALPPLTVTGSVGSENWVRYRQLGEILDHVSIMSYDFAWGGSSPGPISPGWWIEQVYDWAVSQIDQAKISMGLPLYGRFWRIHDYPENFGAYWRGVSGSYYAAWLQFTGRQAWSESGSHHRIGWLTYRDPGSRTLWGFMDCYDWRDAQDYSAISGMVGSSFNERDYVVRYGQPSGVPQWSVADNSVGSEHVTYSMIPEAVVSAEGDLVSPKIGYTLTAEMLQRDPVAATIVDDYATSAAQLSTIYTRPGTWSHWEGAGTYRQYRGTGGLNYNHDFGSRSLYVMARFQFATAGTFSVTSRGVTAELRNDGRLRLLRGSTVLAQTTVAARAVGGAAGDTSRAVLALRVREGSARVYFATAETRVPRVLQAETTPTSGPTGFEASGTAWIDHTYLGDGWWYQPREAVEVVIGGQSRTLGRIAREGITWDQQNRFRPVEDVDETETRSGTVIDLDWVYHHFQGAPVVTGIESAVTVRPLDHDVWLGRVMLVDRSGASLAYFSDAQTIAHWRARAGNDWDLQGIALWTVGQEDARLWEVLAGGELPDETKRIDG